MDENKRRDDDIKYLTEQEDMHLTLRDSFKKYSFDYNYHQGLFGTYFRARIALARHAGEKQGEAVPD